MQSIIDEYVSNDEANEEEDWLDLCRRKRGYNGPAGGPPGLNRDEPHDSKKAVRFRRLCEYFEKNCPELVTERKTTKLIDEDLIFSLAKDYLDLQDAATEENIKTFEYLKQLRIEGVAKGLCEKEIKNIINKEKVNRKWLE